ncbi:hypothetical protein RQP46_002873 [Phenoliferia psychrophenolica]
MSEYAPFDTILEPAASQDVATELMTPPFVGWLLHIMIFGSLATLTFQYMHTALYKQDSRRVKGQNQQRDTNTLLLGVTPLDDVPYALTGTIAAITQLALCERASKFFINRQGLRIAFISVVCLMVFVSWGTSVGCTIISGLFAAGNQSPIVLSNWALNDFIAAWSFLSAGTDSIITVSLVLVLRKEQRGIRRSTDDILRQLISLTMRTGAMTSLFALTCAFVGLGLRNASISSVTMLYLFVYPLSALYVLSYLFTLSARNLRPTVMDTTFSQTDNHASKHPNINHIIMHPYGAEQRTEAGEWTQTGTTNELMPEAQGPEGISSDKYTAATV